MFSFFGNNGNKNRNHGMMAYIVFSYVEFMRVSREKFL